MINKMGALYNIYRAFKGYRQTANLDKWVENNPDLFEIVTSVWKMRKEMGLDWYKG